MRILLLSFYYPPDIGPGSLRAKSLVYAIRKEKLFNVEIEVLTTKPNRYSTLKTDAPALEKDGEVVIHRFELPKHRSGMRDQARAFMSYARMVLQATRGENYDLVLATSSRLMTAALGAWVAKRSKSKLYLDIRDLFTDTMGDLLNSGPFKIFLPIFGILESRTFLAADRINVVSAGFLPHIKRVAPKSQPRVFTNGIDEEFLAQSFVSKRKENKPHKVLYAGNIGDGQGLHVVVPDVASITHGDFHFQIIGDGGRRKALEDNVKSKKLTNIELINPIPRSELFEYYRSADILFIHLNSHDAFLKVLPSKLFEYAATGKPILAGVGGYAADFLKINVPGVEVFEPCNAEQMIRSLDALTRGPKIIDRSRFCDEYLRKSIMQSMAKDILQTINL
jgi:glycosyltransferase involved in cell wall biosynthesis